MRIPKKYGMSKDSHCPFCNKLAIAKNKEGIEVCIDHKNKKLDDIKCTCGSWLEQRVGKFGAYYNCINCGNINFNKAMEIKNIMMLKEQKNKEKKHQEPSEYDSISGDFVYAGGVAETKNFLYETNQRKSVISGKFDLNKLEMDAVVGVAHLPVLDKILSQIPVVGSILTAGDEGSLIKTYYDVDGPFDNPQVTAIPFTSLSKKFLGLFQGILQTSEEILSLPGKIIENEVAN